MKIYLKKHLPIIFYIIYIISIILSTWIIDTDCGLGLIIPFFISYLLIFIISIYYGFKTSSKRKYFLPLFFYLSLYILNFSCFTLPSIIYNPDFKISNLFGIESIKELILNFILFGGTSLIGIFIGFIIKNIKNTIKTKLLS